MEFYYKKEISKLVVKCPPENYEEKELLCYRWVFDSINDERNFLAQAEKNPRVLNNKSDQEKCKYYALSFHITLETSRKHFLYLKQKFKNSYKRFGTNVAKGNLYEKDGVVSEVETNGHFSLHLSRSHNLKENFEIIDSL